MATTPTSMINRLTGVEASTDLLTAPVTPPIVTVAAATTTLTVTQALHGGRVVQCQPTGGLAITLPSPSGTGTVYMFLIVASVTGGNLTIDAKGGDASAVFYGNALFNKVGTGVSTFGTAANSNLITLNGGTTGGLVGDLVEIIDTATHSWTVFISGQATGTIATPFSNH